ncbi:MAG: SDR family NAD(P)-dependent oxidoreductase, partial [Anaerolineae bacterium]|nr:SDR family NAD(P)-dependent oxidoreductase [Anaerolineae bacterium]
MNNNYLEELFSLEDKVAVVTGGGGVLCGAMSRALGRVGVRVAVLDLFEEAAQKVADDIVAAGGEAIAVRCDVLDKVNLEAARDAVLARFGRVDILINGAGGNKKQATTSPDLSFFDLPADAV